MTDRYGSDVLASDPHRSGAYARRRTAVTTPAERGLVVEEVETGFCSDAPEPEELAHPVAERREAAEDLELASVALTISRLAVAATAGLTGFFVTLLGIGMGGHGGMHRHGGHRGGGFGGGGGFRGGGGGFGGGGSTGRW